MSWHHFTMTPQRISSSALGDLNIPNALWKAKQMTFQKRGSRIWNDLLSAVRNAPSLNLFKSTFSAFIDQH